MKKILASLVLAGLTAAAFAQTAPATTTAPAPTVSLSGSMDFGGLLTDVYGANNSQAYMKSFDPVNSSNGRLNFNIKYDAGLFGWYARLREQDNWTAGNTGFPELRRAFAWIDLASGAVRVSAGRLNTQSWSLGGNGMTWEDIGGVDGLVGSTVEFKVVDGLNFGAYVPFDATNDVASKLLEETMFAGRYAVKGLGEVALGFVPGATDGALPSSALATTTVSANNTVTTVPSGNGTYGNDGLVFVNLGYTGMPGLTAYAQVLSAYLGDAVYGFTYVSEKVAYNNFGSDLPLNVQLMASQQISSNSASAYYNPNGSSNNGKTAAQSTGLPTGAGLYFSPQVDYTMDVYNFGISSVILFETETLGTWTDGNQIQNYGFEVDPFVKATVAKGVSIEWFVGFTSGADTLGAGDAYIGGTAPGYRDPKGGANYQKALNGGGLVGNAANGFAQNSALYGQQAAAGNYSLFGVLPNYTVKTGVSLSINY